MWTLTVSSVVVLTALAQGYPVTYTNCGIENTLVKAPQRVITMTQGATEFLLALGVHEQMVGTAYLDDYIWPKYATEYVKIPVLSSAYPNESTIMSVSPDFMISGFNSAFREMYTTDDGEKKGIFTTATVAPCAGVGGEELGMNEKPSNDRTCRKELNSFGIGTFVFQDYCEDKSLRPDVVSEEIVYEEMRALGKIFDKEAHVENLITGMKQDFDEARKLVANNMNGASLKAVWLDCMDSCCPVAEGEEPQVFVGAGSGSPQMLMQEAGLTNAFANVDKNWACVKESEVIAAAPDVIIVVDAAWDTALSKLQWLYNHKDFCDTDVLKAARFIQIPFSATSLGPRNGPAALDLTRAALNVVKGMATHSGESGVSSFNPGYIEVETAGLRCTVEATTTTRTVDEAATTESMQDVSWACGHHAFYIWIGLLMAFTYEVQISQYSRGCY